MTIVVKAVKKWGIEARTIDGMKADFSFEQIDRLRAQGRIPMNKIFKGQRLVVLGEEKV